MRILRLLTLALSPLILFGCGHPIGTEVAAILTDSDLSDKQTVTATAKAILPHDPINESEAAVEENEDGTLTLNTTHTNRSKLSSLDKDDLLLVTHSDMAKHLWRMFRAGAERKLVEVSILHRITVMQGGAWIPFDLIKVRLTLDQIQSISGWDTVDPYDTGEHDILEPDGREITNQIQKKWTTELDQSDQLTVQ
ncbi:MAG: hypothetical protein QF752_17235 [Planctomycetota bacterium]|jgi:hypothetical protein|nr:hypothetical protein [Planctomycetota bacterium]